jgi:2-polyprenyl-6-methoxyphenol hydroxylase-like FAD-dependent oxidoreductase
MALEDAYLLSHLLKNRDDLGNVFQKYDTIRRPRIELFAKAAQRRGDIRRETGVWAQRGKETLMWLWLKIMPLALWLLLKVLPERWMPSSVIYDITTVTLD